MKLSKFALLSAAACGVCGLAFGQSTAYTTPVGYHTLSFQAGSDTSFSLPMMRETALASTVTSVNGSTITVGASMTAGQFTYLNGVQNNRYIFLMTSGASDGKYYSITSNTTSDIVVDPSGDDISALAGTFKVIPLWSLATIFPAGAGVVATTSLGSVKTRIFLNSSSAGQNNPRIANYIYFDATGTANDGWYDANNLGAGIQNNTVLYPDEFFVVRHPVGVGPTSIVLTGAVLEDSISIPLAVTNSSLGQDLYVGIPYPVSISTVATGLYESGAFVPTTNIGSVKDRLFVFNNTSAGLNKPLIENYIYFDATGTANDGWYDANNLGAGKVNLLSKVISGVGFVIKKPAGSPVGVSPWVFTPPYIAQ